MTGPDSGPLAGRTVVVTRATDQAGSLACALRDRGATVVELPVIALVDSADEGAALIAAADRAVDGGYDWIVVTSPNGAYRVVDALRGRPFPGRIAVVGAKTAEPFLNIGYAVDLVPAKALAEQLLAEFPAPTNGVAGSRVLLARAEMARDVLPDGLRAAGWAVDVVVAYRNVAPDVDPEVLVAASMADLVTFTSESTVHRYHGLFAGPAGSSVAPVDAACIGPITAAAARSAGHRVVEADAHSVAGLVDAIEAWAASVGDLAD